MRTYFLPQDRNESIALTSVNDCWEAQAEEPHGPPFRSILRSTGSRSGAGGSQLSVKLRSFPSSSPCCCHEDSRRAFRPSLRRGDKTASVRSFVRFTQTVHLQLQGGAARTSLLQCFDDSSSINKSQTCRVAQKTPQKRLLARLDMIFPEYPSSKKCKFIQGSIPSGALFSHNPG